MAPRYFHLQLYWLRVLKFNVNVIQTVFFYFYWSGQDYTCLLNLFFLVR